MLIWRKKLNSDPDQNNDQRLKDAKKNLLIQGGLAAFTVTVTLILIFAMTTAWYTNVVSTSGLTFQADAWGFEGGVVVDQDAIEAAPGDEGLISLRITNTGKRASTVSVKVSKEYLQDVQMKQRIFFYADRADVVNGEQVEKIYLSNSGGYTYYLPAMNELILSQQVHTDVQLKWEWVYDVVGYYFRGTYDGTGFAIEEYLRPVEYDYDDAQYDPTTGYLTSVDGETDVLHFLEELTQTDGFPGAYSVQQDGLGTLVLTQNGQPVATTENCYPIDQQNNIWLYLCSKQEIQSNTDWDTEYGMSAQEQQKTFQVRISVIGQQFEQEVLAVSDQSSLASALNAGSDELITLQQDIALTDTLTVQSGTKATLDLNGHQITGQGTAVFDVASGAELTVIDGTITGDPAKTAAFKTVGGRITMNDVRIEGVYNALVIADHTTQNDNGDNAFVRITNCQMQTNNVALMVSGDGSASQEKTVLLIQNSNIDSGYIAVSGNGTATNPGRWGTDIQIVDSTVHGLYAGVYQPQMQSCTTISNSTVSGWTGIAVKGGEVTVIDSTVIGVGTDGQVVAPTQAQLSGSGFVDTGDGIYVECTYGYPICVNISGTSKIRRTAQHALAVRVFPEADYVRMNITSGLFDTDVTDYLQDGYVCAATDDGYAVTPLQ